MSVRSSATLVLMTLAVGGCADFGGPISKSSETVLSPQERRLQDAETKLAQLTRRVDAIKITDIDQEADRVREEVRTLRGDMEKLRFDLESRDKSNKELLTNLDRRLARLEGGGAASLPATGAIVGGPGTVPSPSPGTLAAASAPKAAVASPEEEKAYLGTFDLLKNGKYDESIQGFRSMLDQWPQGRYADNGWYWMGEAQYVKRDYAGATGSFQNLISKFSSSPKMPDALLKLGLCQIELKRPADARTSLQRVIREFPSSNAANLAKQKLEQLGG
jgi:tol-pal system protein YbgF